MIKLSILIPTITERSALLENLLAELYRQRIALEYPNVVEFLIEEDNKEISIGAKRNKLLERATGEYVAYLDDDDMISENYLQLLLKAADSDCDCASLKGIITVDGANPEIFEHSLKYNEWKTNYNVGLNGIKYERFPNHLNEIRTSIAKQFKFPEKSFSEDFDWSTEVHKSGLLKTEYYINEVIYFYKFISNKENARNESVQPE